MIAGALPSRLEARRGARVERGRTSVQARRSFERRGERGERLLALTSSGGLEPRHELVWARAAACPQRLELDVPWPALASTLARHASEGFFVACLGATGAPTSASFALLFEPRPPNGPTPRFLGPMPFRDEAGVFFLHRGLTGRDAEELHVRSVAALGAPTNDLGEGLWVAATTWPQPEVHVAYAVHLDAASSVEAWAHSEPFATLASVACPIVALPLSSSEAAWSSEASSSEARTTSAPRASGAWVLSLWHDRRNTPWPRPDPLQIRRRTEGAPRPAHHPAPAQLERRWHWSESRAPSVATVPDATEPAGSDEISPHPLDVWVRAKAAALGARHAQLVVLRGGRSQWARAYTLAEPGYPIATLDTAMRLGSVSKVVALLALLRELDRLRALDPSGPDLLDAALFGPRLLDVPGLAAVRPHTLRDLLEHRAGFRSFSTLAPDHPENPLSEAHLAELLGGPVARPGDLARALVKDERRALLSLPSGLPARPEYANEGYVLLGEIVSHLATGALDRFDQVLADLFADVVATASPEEVRARGALLGSGRDEARRRRESPAHPSSPTWCEARFGRLGDEPLALLPHADNGPFLGGAAGVCVPLCWVADLLRELHRGGATSIGSRWSQSMSWDGGLSAPVGFERGSAGYWSTSRGEPEERRHRVARLHRNGRMEGGAALLVHQIPLDPDGEEAALSVLVAFNQLGTLSFETDGEALLGILETVPISLSPTEAP